MKNIKNISPIILIIMFVVFTNQTLTKNDNRDYTIAELLGKWNNKNSDKSRKNKSYVKYIQFVNDSIAEIHIIDSNIEKKVIGNWKNKYEKKIKKLGVKLLDISSDISISYWSDKNSYNLFLLKLSEENGKLTMSAYEAKFQKE